MLEAVHQIHEGAHFLPHAWSAHPSLNREMPGWEAETGLRSQVDVRAKPEGGGRSPSPASTGNVIHTDLKPANFLMVQGRLKLIDFGIADHLDDDCTSIERDCAVFARLSMWTAVALQGGRRVGVRGSFAGRGPSAPRLKSVFAPPS